MQIAGTVEGVHEKITRKLELIAATADVITDLKTKLSEDKHIREAIIASRKTAKVARDHIAEYELAVTSELCAFYTNSSRAHGDMYFHAITRENLDGVCAQLSADLTSITKMFPRVYVAANSVVFTKIKSNITEIDSITFGGVIAVDTSDNGKCDCGCTMEVAQAQSEWHCPMCSRTCPIVGVAFGENQLYPSDKPTSVRARSTQNYTKHSREWLDCILGNTYSQLDQAVVAKVVAAVARRGIPKSYLDCETMRKILSRECNDSDYFKHTTALIIAAGGHPPPTLTPAEITSVCMKFDLIMTLLNQLEPNKHKPYYPYMFYKIFDSMYPHKHENRRILKYIHLQSTATIIKRDALYKKICAISGGELVYKPTDHNDR